jgi:transposase InsO family protein
LEGKANWTTWKYKISVCLRGVSGAMDVVQGRLVAPNTLQEDATAAQTATYKSALEVFNKADSNALIILTTNMSDETLQKIMRFTTSREVWLELHKLFDGVSEDKVYNLCLQFFGFKRNPEVDIASHISKLKTLWSELKQEMMKDEANLELPDLFLICKILGTLPDDYFSFKSSWMLMSKSDRTVDNLTNQLCAYERALGTKEDESSDQKALVVNSSKQASQQANVVDSKKKKKLICHYCKKPNHTVKVCRKWIADGRPPKSSNPEPGTNMTLVSITSTVMNSESSNKDWYVDNGATSHITNDKNSFRTLEPFSTTHSVTTANGEKIEAIGKGTVEIEAAVGGRWNKITLTDVWCVPSIQKNLFSVLAAQDKRQNSEFISTTETCNFKVDGLVQLIGVCDRFGGLYKLAVRSTKTSSLDEVNVTGTNNLLQLYHERFGHQNKRHVKSLLSKELNIKVEMDSELCEGCMYGKAHRLPFGTRTKTTKAGERVHTDVCGPFQESMSGFKYFVLFKDDYTKFRTIYFLKEKSEVAEKLSQFLAETKTVGHVIKELLSDNGKEFDNKDVRSMLQKEGIIQRLTMPYTPQQNGCSERENRTVVETARAIMHAHGNIPQTLWAEIVRSANYILNRTGPSNVPGTSPYELWYGKKPGLKHLRVIGSTCYVHVPKQTRKKMDPKATKGILIGYDHDDGYRIFDKEECKLIRSRDVVFEEKTLEHTKSVIIPEDDSTSKQEIQADRDDELTDDDEEEQETEDTSISGTSESDCEHNADRTTRCLRNRSTLKAPEKLQDYVMHLATSLEEPETYGEAMKSDQKDYWKEAMDREMKALQENETWELVDLPQGKRAISNKWVYKVKTNADGSIDKFKARLVIKGYSQQRGIDYDETFSPVARKSTIRTLLSVAANEGMKLAQIDVSTAFLYGDLKETIYMQQPEGHGDGSGRVCRLKKSLYGLKQAPRCWNEKFSNYIIKLGFRRSEADPCLFVRQTGSTKMFFVLYVDDGLIAANDEQELQQFIDDLGRKFKITAKPASFFLGLEINREEDGSVRVSQTHYTEKLLERFNMSNCKAVTTPIVKDNDTEESSRNSEFPYRQAVGALMFLMCGTRPDIAYALSVVSRNLENPTDRDVVRVKRILRYLRGTTNCGLLYKNNQAKGVFECYSDADHGGDLSTGRSTSGVLCLHSGAPISWMSQRQSSVAISTTEAEVVAASEAAREIIWIKRILTELDQLKATPTLQIDNEAAIRLAQNPEFHRRTKHIRIRHFFVRELVTAGEIMVSKVDSEKQLADILTKPLFSTRFRDLCNDMGICKLLNKGEC